CDRGDREHYPPYRSRNAAVPRSAQGCGGDRIYGPVDEHFADRRIHSDLDDEWCGGPAVPGIRRHPVDCHRAVDGGVALGDTDDVRVAAQGAEWARRAVQLERTRLSLDHFVLRIGARYRARSPAACAGDRVPRNRSERLSLHEGAERILPTAG